jgi:hypothetical protein
LAGALNASFFGLPLSLCASDCWLVKTDGSGNMQWNKTYGDAGSDCAYSLIQTADGGYALAGIFFFMFYTSLDDPYDRASIGDCLLVKTDPLGNMVWNQTYGGASVDDAYSLVATPDGGYALAGGTGLTLTAGGDFWLIKTDSIGVVPEFSSWLIPSLMLVATTSIAINKKKLLSGRSQEP